jgi:hypothetical protein
LTPHGTDPATAYVDDPPAGDQAVFADDPSVPDDPYQLVTRWDSGLYPEDGPQEPQPVPAQAAAAPAPAGTAERLLQVARGEIGVRETGGGSAGNRQKYSRDLHLPFTEWCAIFVSWCLWKAGVPHRYEATTVTMFARHYRALGRYVATPLPGDLVCFSWGVHPFDHIGIVAGTPGNGFLETVEGNTNPGDGQDGVYRRTRSTRFVRGYCRPQYASAGGPAPAPRFHVVAPGDTLGGIAAAYRIPLDALLRLNPRIHHPDLIHPGDRIRVS